jgi:hypothetical protein
MMLKVQHGRILMLELLAQLAAAATPGEPVDWRHVTWPAHDTATMRALLDNNLVHSASHRRYGRYRE